MDMDMDMDIVRFFLSFGPAFPCFVELCHDPMNVNVELLWCRRFRGLDFPRIN
jgi:hypothetical protein